MFLAIGYLHSHSTPGISLFWRFLEKNHRNKSKGSNKTNTPFFKLFLGEVLKKNS